MTLLESHKIKTIDEIVQDAIENHGIEKFYCLISGGKDSVSATHYIAKNYPRYFAGSIFAITGVGSQSTKYFVLDLCKKMNWKLNFTWPKEGERFIDIALQHGFAGPGNHRMWMGYLKYHPWRSFIKERLDENPCLISGVRHNESQSRKKKKQYSQKPIDWDDKLCFVKPFFHKNGTEIYKYLANNDLKASPVHDWLRISGDCYCGAFAAKWELMLIKNYDPLAYEHIKWVEKQIQLRGSKKAKKYPTWNSGPSTDEIEEQTLMEDYCGESCGY